MNWCSYHTLNNRAMSGKKGYILLLNLLIVVCLWTHFCGTIHSCLRRRASQQMRAISWWVMGKEIFIFSYLCLLFYLFYSKKPQRNIYWRIYLHQTAMCTAIRNWFNRFQFGRRALVNPFWPTIFNLLRSHRINDANASTSPRDSTVQVRKLLVWCHFGIAAQLVLVRPMVRIRPTPNM